MQTLIIMNNETSKRPVNLVNKNCGMEMLTGVLLQCASLQNLAL